MQCGCGPTLRLNSVWCTDMVVVAQVLGIETLQGCKGNAMIDFIFVFL